MMLTDQQLHALAEAMVGQSAFLREIDAGYTYFGQFISHEIVPETRKLDGGRVVQPFLNLDSLYARPGAVLTPDGKFPIRPAIPGGPKDLPRYDGIALIPERRNDENVIVAQLHLFWQRFHNYLRRKRFAHDAGSARRLVTLVFQLLVVEDYLRLLLAPTVFNSYFRCNERWLGFAPGTMPPEFALAAFRFGHSMVRADYELQHDVFVGLPKLFKPNQNLDPGLEVDWKLFFGWPAPHPLPPHSPQPVAQHAMMIDLNITPEMGNIPVAGQPVPVNIIHTNLLAGNGFDLPSGAAYVTNLLRSAHGAALKSLFKLEAPNSLGAPLDRRLPAAAGIGIHNLPLWPYVLLEAEKASSGFRLGVLASLICAEVLANAIAHAEHSIYPQGRCIALDDVLATLGPLGRTIQAVRQAQAPFVDPAKSARTFCMRHIIELVENPDSYP